MGNNSVTHGVHKDKVTVEPSNSVAFHVCMSCVVVCGPHTYQHLQHARGKVVDEFRRCLHMPRDGPSDLPDRRGKHLEVAAAVRTGIVDDLSRRGALYEQGLELTGTKHCQPSAIGVGDRSLDR